MKTAFLAVCCLAAFDLRANSVNAVSPASEAALHVDIEVSEGTRDRPAGDECPARVWLDFPQLIQDAGLTGKPDLGTLRIIREAPSEGSTTDLPFRWDPPNLSGDFPSVERAVHETKGHLTETSVSGAGLFFNVSEDSDQGFLVWQATRGNTSEETATYRLSVVVRPPESARTPPPRSWIGDGTARFSSAPPNSTGSSHTRVAVTDWNGNGLNDVVYGESSGRLIVMLNEGTNAKPVFNRAQFIKNEKYQAIDVGHSAAPVVVDWDGDGFKDLLVGTHWNRLLFFKNTGDVDDPRFSYQGLVQLEGKPLELPIEPVTGRPAGAFIRDYYPVPSVVDWNGDGDPDLLLGGYLTGRIFVFENTGKLDDGTPSLRSLGPLSVDGKPLNVGDWGASPEFADLDGDGLPDLLTGNLPMTEESQARKAPIRYFKNVGTVGNPTFKEKSFPGSAPPPRGSLYTPRAADMNGDGLLDLVVSSGANIFIFPNIGSRTAPQFSINSNYLRPAWGNSPINVTQWIDWNGNGQVDAISNYTIQLNSGAPDPFDFARPVSALPRGQMIAHPSGIGDDWFHPRFFDFDQDGDLDILFGDWHGQVWLHERDDGGSYDLTGSTLKLENGDPIKVGPKNADPASDFRALQGARTVFTASDFTGNGKTDLVVGDTFGIVRLFANVGTNSQPVFREAQTLGNLGTRLSVEAIDWNDDGSPDVIAGSAGGRVRVFINRKNSTPEHQFEEGIDPGLPPIPQPRILVGDLNGDGDQDLFSPSTQGSVWIERSFIRYGYLEGKVTSAAAGGP